MLQTLHTTVVGRTENTKSMMFLHKWKESVSQKYYTDLRETPARKPHSAQENRELRLANVQSFGHLATKLLRNWLLLYYNY